MTRWALLAALLAILASVVAAAPTNAARGDGVLDVLVTDSRGSPLGGAVIDTDGRTTTTDHWGRARLTDVAAGDVTVTHDRFPIRVVEWADTGDRLHVLLGAPVLRAIHVAGTLVGTDRWDALVDLTERTALNAFMLDIKDESGRVFPTTSSSWAIAAGANLDRWDLEAVVADLHARDISVIGRIVSFQDPVAGPALPDLAVKTTTGAVFSRRGQTFLDPTDPDAREYALQLAEEACAAGVDEVQFDYVRYPDGNQSNLVFDGGKTEELRIETIRSFLAEAKERVEPGCAIAADIFGFVTSVPGDGGIGHQLETLAGVADVLSPMSYPNHWSTGWFGFDEPADNPGGVIDASMRDAIFRAGGLTTIRPWLQDFGGYGPAEVRAQIDAADALGLGWMLWNAASVFTEAGIPLESEVATDSVVPAAAEQNLPVSGFWDVPDASTFSADVAWLGEQGITQGCNAPWGDDYCPANGLTRGEAATMLVRALDLPPANDDRFVDDDGTTHEADINALAAAGITQGCAEDRFCPSEVLTRQQMASLIARALELPPAGEIDVFTDVDGSSHQADIHALAAAGVTRGCSPTTFCPARGVRRDEVAAFLHRALG
ncbi:MAG: putative glycoside hydrolase [Actinomycetota bacterium]